MNVLSLKSWVALAFRLLSVTYIRYGLVSVLALLLDTGTLLALHRLGWVPWGAAALAYMVGAVLHWELSVRFVFPAPADRADYMAKLIQYIAVGAFGGVVTSLTVQAATAGLGLGLIWAKGLAVIIVFNMIYLVRRFLMK